MRFLLTSITTELSTLESGSDCIGVADGPTSSVDKPSALLEVLEEVSVDETASTFMERRVHGDDVTLGNELLEVLDSASVDGLSGCFRERVVVKVEELLAVEG